MQLALRDGAVFSGKGVAGWASSEGMGLGATVHMARLLLLGLQPLCLQPLRLLQARGKPWLSIEEGTGQRK